MLCDQLIRVTVTRGKLAKLDGVSFRVLVNSWKKRKMGKGEIEG